MKVLIMTQVVDDTHPVLGFMTGWIAEFAKHSERVDVICFSKGEYQLPEHVHVHSLGKERGVSKATQLLLFYSHFRTALRQQPSFVFFHMGAIFNVLAAPFYLFKKVKRRGPTYLWWKTHGHINWLGRLALLSVDRVLTATAESFPIETTKKRVIGHAIDLSMYGCTERNVETDIIYVGRIDPVKRLETFIDTIVALRKQGQDPNFKLIGDSSNREYYEQLLQYAHERGVSEQAFVGSRSQPDVVRENCHTQFLLSPSETQSLDKTILESMACGVIPLTANCACKELLGPFDLYHEVNDPAWYARRIQELRAQDTTKLQSSLREIVHAKHSLSTFPERVFGSSIEQS